MLMQQPTGGPGIGLRTRDERVQTVARAAFEKGDVVMFDLANSDGDVSDNNMDGGDDSGFANVINPAAAQEGYGLFGIAREAISDNDETDSVVIASGRIQAFIHTVGTGSAAKYDALVIDVGDEVNALTYDAPAATEGRKVLGIALEVVTTPTDPTLGFVAFDGINGFGFIYTET